MEKIKRKKRKTVKNNIFPSLLSQRQLVKSNQTFERETSETPRHRQVLIFRTLSGFLFRMGLMAEGEEGAGSSEMDCANIIETTSDSLNSSVVFHVLIDILGFVLYMHHQIPSYALFSSTAISNLSLLTLQGGFIYLFIFKSTFIGSFKKFNGF